MQKLKLFEAYGIESEYMIVDQLTLQVKPIAHLVLEKLAHKKKASEYKDGDITWSNELALHVLELKCSQPLKSFYDMHALFLAAIKKMNSVLEDFRCVLMPTAMHPWMNPDQETQLWPYGQKEIYKAYNDIFGCSGHGWSNLQSVHINLPFSNDDEFGRLHAAIRVVLPIIPRLTASSPFYDSKKQALSTNRLEFYRLNQKKIPMIAGDIIPEPVFHLKDYQDLLMNIYKEVQKFDPKKILCHPWVNSRGAIPKFDDHAIEIRLMDIQECTLSDFALISLIVQMVKKITLDDEINHKSRNYETKQLKNILLQSMSYEDFKIPQCYVELFFKGGGMLMSEFIKQIVDQNFEYIDSVFHAPLKTIVIKGNLSQRLTVEDSDLMLKYKKLVHCLSRDRLYE